jgi:hypothetical protein
MSIETRVRTIERALNPLGDDPHIVVIIDDICGQPTAKDIEAARQQAIKEFRPVCIVRGGEANEP